MITIVGLNTSLKAELKPDPEPVVTFHKPKSLPGQAQRPTLSKQNNKVNGNKKPVDPFIRFHVPTILVEGEEEEYRQLRPLIMHFLNKVIEMRYNNLKPYDVLAKEDIEDFAKELYLNQIAEIYDIIDHVLETFDLPQFRRK